MQATAANAISRTPRPSESGALYHPPGAIARHDAVAWAYARGADRKGVEIHQQTAVTDIALRDGAVVGVQTDKGYIHTKRVLSAVAGWSTRIQTMVGLPTPLVVHPLQAMVTEPLKPWLDTIVVSSSLHTYISQSSRGELVAGASRATCPRPSTPPITPSALRPG